MSHTDSSALAAYNSLMDPHLGGYFSNLRMRKHLRKSGLITRSGEIVSENTYRLNMARKEHKKHVRDLLAQAIVHKTLDMERNRQVAIRKKLEEIAKMELVRRVRTERSRKGDEEILPYLSPRPKSAKGSQYGSRPMSGKPASGRPKSAPSKGRDTSPVEDIVILDDDGMPVSPQSRSRSGSSSSSTSPSPRGRSPPKKSKYPRGELDDRHLYSLNQQTLREYTMARHSIEHGHGPSPYLMSQLPSPPQSGRPKSPKRNVARNRRTVTATDSMGRPLKPRSNKGSLALHRREPPMRYQQKPHSNVEVTIHYFGSNLKLDCEKFDPRDEVLVEQQHCGGNTLIVYREKILPGSCFTFISRRHRGFPFGLTFYVNGMEDCRLSACCEYKHRLGSRLGGKQGHFGIRSIQGAAPCYKCQVCEEMREGEARPQQKRGQAQEEKDEVEVSVEEKNQPDTKTQGETTRTEYDVKGEGEETERPHNESVEVPVDDAEDKDTKQDYDYEDDFDADDDKKKGESTGRSSRSASTRSSRSTSSSDSRSTSSSSSRRRSRSSSSSSRSTSRSDTERSKNTKSPDLSPVQPLVSRDTAVRSPTPTDQPPVSKDDSVRSPTPPEPVSKDTIVRSPTPTDQSLVSTDKPVRSPTPPDHPADHVVAVNENRLADVGATQRKTAANYSDSDSSTDSDSDSDSTMSIPRHERSMSYNTSDDDRYQTPDDTQKTWLPRSQSPGPQSPRQEAQRKPESPRQDTKLVESPRQDRKSPESPRQDRKSPESPRQDRESPESPRQDRNSPRPDRKSPESPRQEIQKTSMFSPGSSPSHSACSSSSSDSSSDTDSSTIRSDSPTPRRPPTPPTHTLYGDTHQRPGSTTGGDTAVSTTEESGHTDYKKEQSDQEEESKPVVKENASKATDSDTDSDSTETTQSARSEKDSIIDTIPDEALYQGKYEYNPVPEAAVYERREKGSETIERVVAPPSPVLVGRKRSPVSSDENSDSSDTDSESDEEAEQSSQSKPDKPPSPQAGVDSTEKKSIRGLMEGRSDLELTGKELTSAQVDELCECIKENGTVHSLTLRNSGIDDKSVEKLAQVLVDTAPSTDLRMLNLNCNQITQAGVPHILRVVTAKTDMKILLMHGNPLGNGGVTELVRGLVQTHHFRQSDEERLSKEELQSIRATAQDLVSDVMKEVLHVSTTSTDSQLSQTQQASGGLPLTQLDIGDCDMTERGATSVADLISANTNIRTLGLTGNKSIGITGWLAIGDALRNNTHILSLSLDYNDLGDAGAAVLAEALKENSSIKELDLEGNKIGEEGASRLLEMLEENRSLQDITLFRGNNISDETLEKINRALKK